MATRGRPPKFRSPVSPAGVPQNDPEAGPDLSGDSAGAIVAQGATLVRIQNETMMAVSIQNPRDEKRAFESAIAELDSFPDYASEAWYAIPYKNADGETEWVEGPSIKAAMPLARRWGNCDVSGMYLGEDENGYDVQGTFTDYESRFRVSRPARVSKWLKRRDGSVSLLREDRKVMALQSGVSKAIRNAIVAGLPTAFVIGYVTKAQEIGSGKVEACLKAFAELGVKVGQLEQLLAVGGQKTDVRAWKVKHLARLRGLYTAIKEGSITVASVFGESKTEGGVAPMSKAQAETAAAQVTEAGPGPGAEQPERGELSPIQKAWAHIKEMQEAKGVTDEHVLLHIQKTWNVKWQDLTLLQVQQIGQYLAGLPDAGKGPAQGRLV